MKYDKLFACAAAGIHAGESGRVQTVRMDESVVPGCMFSDVSWYTRPFSSDGMIRHDSDEVCMFAGSDPGEPENLAAEIEFRIENDRLMLTDTCFVFVPKGAAHGIMSVKSLKKPFIRCSCHLNISEYAFVPAEASEPAGKYAGNAVMRYEPVDGKLPEAPEGFLHRLLWMDGKKLAGAPYIESVWFMTTNDTGPAPHAHDFDEIIGFIGTDPEHPEELGAEIHFCVEDEEIPVNKSCLIYIPRGVKHSPIYVPSLKRPIIHFSGGNGGDYARKNALSESNNYKPGM